MKIFKTATLVFAFIGFNVLGQTPKTTRTENVFLILVDGLRWQEVFYGADTTMMNKANGEVADSVALRKAYWRDTPETRRATLMPFLWNVVGKQGQLYGNQEKGSIVKVTNKFHFSYPGYSEMIVGYADSAINSNKKFLNPNVSVFEWLHQKPRFKNKVAAFGAWDVVSWIINYARCGFYVNSGVEPVTAGKVSAEQALLNRLKAELHHPWGGEPYDAITFYAALEYLKANQPRAMWITFGETDEFAHAGRYDHYLEAAHRTDYFLKVLWETVQAMPQYRNKTTFIVAVDHGRGFAPKEWTSHGAKIKGAENIWIAIIGPDTPALGERINSGNHTQSQIAATVAAVLGENYNAAQPKAAPPLREALNATK